jgi:glycosyltransferase involved in cell wall biosynthesis
MKRLGFSGGPAAVLRNGVDTELFHEEPRASVRERLGLHGVVAMSVGNLVELKGHHLAIEALQSLPGVNLVIIGDGPEARSLKALAKSCQLEPRVRFVGVVPQTELRAYYSAADLLILASSREGWPNVLLEAMACGTPVVATRVWGVPEIVAAPEAGVLVDERSAPALADGVRRLLGANIKRHRTRAYAGRFGWDETTRAQLDVFSSVLERARS